MPPFRDLELDQAPPNSQCVLGHQLTRYLPRKLLVDTALDLNLSQFLALELDILAQFLALAREISMLSLGLGTDPHVFSGRHRHGPRDKSSHAGNQNIARLGRCGRDADDQTRRRHDPVIGPQYRSTQPADTFERWLSGCA